MLSSHHPRTDFRSQIFQMCNSLFLTDDRKIDKRLRDISSDIYDSLMLEAKRTKCPMPPNFKASDFKRCYLQFVLEPECLIYLLIIRDKLDREEAEEVILLTAGMASHHPFFTISIYLLLKNVIPNQNIKWLNIPRPIVHYSNRVTKTGH